MKKHLFTVCMLLLAVAGSALLLYPTVSDAWNKMVQTRVINQYEAELDKMKSDDVEQEFKAAQAYNRELAKLSYPLMNYGKAEGYEDIFNIDGNGTMGYLDIEKIHVHLPIRHGTTADVLNDSVGHLRGSSLPTGEKGTHTVLSAHRGLPTARLFTDLDRLDVGDFFTLTILNRTFTYQVEQIMVVEPDEVEELYAKEGKDYCTLMTCTPYGVNTHRLLLRGKRADSADESEA